MTCKQFLKVIEAGKMKLTFINNQSIRLHQKLSISLKQNRQTEHENMSWTKGH